MKSGGGPEEVINSSQDGWSHVALCGFAFLMLPQNLMAAVEGYILPAASSCGCMCVHAGKMNSQPSPLLRGLLRDLRHHVGGGG